ncbi:MAG TPA: DNA mismatch repair protein MutS [Desulfobacteraceae bacterium]|nr:DNA mismatch repair protein MutS [Desulfobacteraceae bacterium]
MNESHDQEPVSVPVNGVLDLHTFSPRDVSSVVQEYLRACQEKGILEVRIIHGKGKGVLRRQVHTLLEKHPRVATFGLDAGTSSWGATVVRLKGEVSRKQRNGGRHGKKRHV